MTKMFMGVGLTLLCAIVVSTAGPASDVPPVLRGLLSNEFRFSSSELADLEAGKVVARRLGATAYGEAGAVGAVRILGRKETFVDLYRDIAQFKRGPSVVSIGMFGDPPSVLDLAPLAVNSRDLNLRECRMGDCDIRLTASAIKRLQSEIDWTTPDAEGRAAVLFKEIFAGYVQEYMSGGPGRITQYDSQRRPIHPVDDFSSLLAGSPYIDRLAPGLARHLEAYPANRLPRAEDFVYWSTEKFGRFAPFVSATHVTLTQSAADTWVIVSKNVYSSRYFDASLSLTIATDAVQPGAFYLVYVNRSRSSVLKGAFAGMRRAFVERGARGSVEENLELTKLKVEKLPR